MSCLLSMDRDMSGWANLRTNLEINNMYKLVNSRVLRKIHFIIWNIKLSENLPVPTQCAADVKEQQYKEKSTQIATLYLGFSLRSLELYTF